MAGYWNSNYWHANYWHANYWVPTGDVGTLGDYWHDNYWHANYWHLNYWAKINTGDVNQFNTPNLVLSPQFPTVNVELNVQPTTPSLPLATFQADANLDIDPAVTLATLPLVSFDASVGVEGYQLGDIDLRLVPDSAQVVTYGVFTTLQNLPFVPMAHTVEEGGGVNVAASLAALPLASFVTDARLDIAVEPLPASLPISGFNTTAGIGTQVPATLAALTFTAATHTIVATAAQADVTPATQSIVFITNNASVTASPHLEKPPSTFGDYGALIINGNADVFPSNYEICERTGFRVRRGGLVKEWNGTMVRPESFEPRHPQDFVRAIAEQLEGSPRPEQDDRFIGEDVPQVTAADL